MTFYQGVVSGLVKTPYWMYGAIFLFLIVTELVSAPRFNTYLWLPPAKGQLLTANGTFLPLAKTAASPGMVPALAFQTNAGEIIELNCEPQPAINDCLEGPLAQAMGQTVQIQYASRQQRLHPEPYNLLMAVSRNGAVIITYEQRLDDIRHTRISVVPATNEVRRVRISPVAVRNFLIKEAFTWGIFLLALLIKTFA